MAVTEVKYYKGRDYEKNCANNGAFLDQVANDNDAFEAALAQQELHEERVEVLKKVNKATGLDFNVAVDGLEKNVAAFIKTDGSNEVFINEDLLQREHTRLAVYAAMHEKMHKDTGIFHLDLAQNLEREELQVLRDALSVQHGVNLSLEEFCDLDWVEACNDALTKDVVAGHEDSGYKNIVKVAEAMDRLGELHLGETLTGVFRNSPKGKAGAQAVYAHLRALVQKVVAASVSVAA